MKNACCIWVPHWKTCAAFFRQAMFADFEREVHARVDKGESLTGEELTKSTGIF
jgi:oligoendopeptidase F